MSNDKEQWKDEVMNSLDGIHRADAPDFMYTRIVGRLEAAMNEPVSSYIPLKRAWVALACFMLLCAFDIGFLKAINHSGKNIHEAHGSSPYAVDNTNFNLY